MVIAVYMIRLIIPESQSLKDKRRAIMQLRDKITKKFNVAFAELEHHELWNKATLGIASLANEQQIVNQALDNAMNLIYEMPHIEVIECQKEFL